ncbi:ubiquitin-like autophagy protein Apg12-domain-containing protein [Exophiala viscosa]|uniref:Ubiquitin-like protein ATG12 n=1 Tax=Exophiala viscosa TaxID=2486360 RepID=A0AAN6IBM8_9EURO|nr:ubiquitin-like autophagy protein Apg12-domain-containing protein [Exophiala viscosa]KAI1623691.1 ubiquitin-like autophagy protein Apg12-domain-containing protein [Exophiala viscosa]
MSSPGLSTRLPRSTSQNDQQPDINTDLAGTAEHDNDDEQENEACQGDLPMSMTASVILTNLPRDASQALKDVEEIDDRKVSVRFQPIGSAPILKQRVFKINASSKFSVVLNFLRKKLGVKDGDGVFLYVNSVFAPGLDEGVGNLFRCFKTDEQLIVSYSTTPAFG